ncbi:SufD family Fe-S cluster assembly protein [Sphingomonas sp. BN140010]|uniref:SufD family Fe-S cluster assembly protein n=1 Tax=Sphingomonas arvum TaxID=2992113 RepID=A0ABT3JFM1_9SPHN|nr:SufD family Fe-S cluster assembly protein [Sphingomonas sp. BN140010]MCW3797871.1 SufD family Fe-S cluster assembly protein [Sphingomonas sp. BN140010]
MTALALPTRKDEAYRYADLDALGRVWADLAQAREIVVPAGEAHSHVLLAANEAVEVHRARLVIQPGASLDLFALNGAAEYGRIEMDVEVREGARFTLNAANIAGGKATQEIVTHVRHTEPNGTSNQTVRSVLGGTATGSYLGKVAVARQAQKVDGEQSVKAMLLDRGATANCKPELEIYADDVKCAHGATVGELDPTQLFYAMSRGLPPAEAKALLLEGFVLQLWDDAPEDRRDELVEASRALLRRVAA